MDTCHHSSQARRLSKIYCLIKMGRMMEVFSNMFPIHSGLLQIPTILCYSYLLLLLNLVPTVTVVTDVLLDKVRMGALKK